jgi:phage-related minor tail protein
VVLQVAAAVAFTPVGPSRCQRMDRLQLNTWLPGDYTGSSKRRQLRQGHCQVSNGGIVSSPTLFKFADGGTTRTGLMGEAGPEAIMPLKRGADGSLGVQANGLREAMNQDRAGGSGSPVLNMSFQSTSINGVEYVSRDQLEQAMAQTRRDASRDGAKRGMTMTLDKLQQSPSTRSRVGMR